MASNDRPPRAYPAALRLIDRPCLVVGAGEVAARKVEGLLAAGARVSVVALSAVSLVEQWAAQGRITFFRRAFLPGDAAGMMLLFACTDDPAVNGLAASAGREAGALVNRADDPADCDFTVMGVFERGGLLVGVSTGAESPAFARWFRAELERHFGPEYGELLAMLASLRPEVLTSLPAADRASAFERVLKSSALSLLREGDPAGALAEARRSLGLHGPLAKV